MTANKKTTPANKKQTWKIYMFFSKGEFLTAVDAKNKTQAMELFKAQEFLETDYDLLISYEHCTQRYCIGGK